MKPRYTKDVPSPIDAASYLFPIILDAVDRRDGRKLAEAFARIWSEWLLHRALRSPGKISSEVALHVARILAYGIESEDRIKEDAEDTKEDVDEDHACVDGDGTVRDYHAILGWLATEAGEKPFRYVAVDAQEQCMCTGGGFVMSVDATQSLSEVAQKAVEWMHDTPCRPGGTFNIKVGGAALDMKTLFTFKAAVRRHVSQHEVGNA